MDLVASLEHRAAGGTPAAAVCRDGSKVPAPDAFSCSFELDPPEALARSWVLPALPPQPLGDDPATWRQHGTPLPPSTLIYPWDSPEGPFHASRAAAGNIRLPQPDSPCLPMPGGKLLIHLPPSPTHPAKRGREDLLSFWIDPSNPAASAPLAPDPAGGRAVGVAGPPQPELERLSGWERWQGCGPSKIVNSHPLAAPTPHPAPPPALASHPLDDHLDFQNLGMGPPDASDFNDVELTGVFESLLGPQPKKPRHSGGKRNRPGGGARPVSARAANTPRRPPPAPAAAAATATNHVPHYMRPGCIPRPTREVLSSLAPPSEPVPDVEEPVDTAPVAPVDSDAVQDATGAGGLCPPAEVAVPADAEVPHANDEGNGDGDVWDVAGGYTSDTDSWLNLDLELEPFETDALWADDF